LEVSWQEIIFAFVGGLGLFLFGINTMSDGLQSVAGDRMRSILEKGTRSPFRGVLTGILVTGLIQSSSATTVLTVGLVNAELLTLRQAIGVIMGANIGTTVTAYLIGFNLKDYALPILGLGAIIYLFAKQKKTQTIGKAIFGFGVLFFGLSIMGDGMKPLKDLSVFADFMVRIDNNALIGVVIGTVFTGIVQSSSATIGVLQELVNQGAVTYSQAVPILFGDNIGTTITALLAGVGASVAARRAALTHFLFNVMGTMIFLPLFVIGFLPEMITFVTNTLFSIVPGFTGTWETLNPKLQIAQTHAIFNMSNTLIHLPLVGVLAAIVTFFIPDREEHRDEVEFRIRFIDHRFLNNPSVALAQATRETLRMAELTRQAFENAIEYFYTREESLAKRGEILEETIDNLERQITDFVVLASEKHLSREDSSQAQLILQSLNDIERIADISESIIEGADYATKHHVVFSGEAEQELAEMINLTRQTLESTLLTLERKDKILAQKVVAYEQRLDEMQEEYRKAHIRRLNERICNGNNGAVFLDLISNLERISDHCRNIAGYVFPNYDSADSPVSQGKFV
jgi:phosphate:Na+ symporter